MSAGLSYNKLRKSLSEVSRIEANRPLFELTCESASSEVVCMSNMLTSRREQISVWLTI